MTATQVKKSIYLNAELDRRVRESAAAEGRSVTKQIEILLLRGLNSGNATVYFTPKSTWDLAVPAKPDPRVKPPLKKLK